VPMNHRLLVPRKTPGLLDLVPGAAAAYSLRSLSRSYADPVVTVRRSSDDAEEDFTASEVADGTLAAFCGAGDGFVYRWWDQSGNARHAVAPADANEPQIVDSGVVVTEEGKPAIQFDGSDDHLDANTLASLFSGTDKPLSVALVCVCDTASGSPFVFSFGNSSSNLPLLIFRSLAGAIDMTARDNANNLNQATGGSALSQSVVFAFSNMDTIVLRQNGAGIANGSASLGDTTLNRFSVGCQTRISKINFFSGTIQELIVYPSDQTANRELLEGNIAWGWSA